MKDFLYRLLAVLLLSVPAGWLASVSQEKRLQVLNDNPEKYVDHLRQIYANDSIALHFFLYCIMGVAFICLVEGIVFLLRGDWRRLLERR